MITKFISLFTDLLYRNSLVLMLNSAFAAFFGFLFWIVIACTMPAQDKGLVSGDICGGVDRGGCRCWNLMSIRGLMRMNRSIQLLIVREMLWINDGSFARGMCLMGLDGGITKNECIKWI